MGDFTAVDIGEVIFVLLVFTGGVGGFFYALNKED